MFGFLCTPPKGVFTWENGKGVGSVGADETADGAGDGAYLLRSAIGGQDDFAAKRGNRFAGHFFLGEGAGDFSRIDNSDSTLASRADGRSPFSEAFGGGLAVAE